RLPYTPRPQPRGCRVFARLCPQPLCMSRPHRRSSLFPYTTLFRSRSIALAFMNTVFSIDMHGVNFKRMAQLGDDLRGLLPALSRDRKSTRLNSSHVSTSDAVFCLKKKKAEAADTEGVRMMRRSHAV